MKKTNTIKTRRLTRLIFVLLIILSLTACDLFKVLAEDEFFVSKYNINSETISPGMKSVINSPATLLKWATVEAAGSYDLQLSTNEAFSGSLLIDASGLTSAEYQTPTLPGYGRYYWKVRAHLSDGNTSQWFAHAFSYISTDIFEHFEQFEEGGFSTLHDWILAGEQKPVIQDEKSCDGFHSAKISSSSYWNKSSMSNSIELATPRILSFKYLKPDSAYFSFYIGNSYQDIYDGGLDKWTYHKKLLPAGTHTLKWEFSNRSSNDEDAMFIDTISITEVPTFINEGFETVDSGFSTLNDWYLSGDSLPHIQSTEAYEGSNSVQLDCENSSDESILETILNVEKESTISFFVLTENNEHLKFYVDNSVKLYTSSESSEWTEFEYELSPGVHSLKWRYDTYSNGTTSACIDSIKVTER